MSELNLTVTPVSSLAGTTLTGAGLPVGTLTGTAVSLGVLSSGFGSNPNFGTVTATTFSFANWTITESGGSLYFATGGTNKMKLDSSGNLQVVGNVESSATIS